MNRRDFFGATAGALIVAPVMGMVPTRFPDEIILLIDEDGLVTEMWSPPPSEYFLTRQEITHTEIMRAFKISRRMLNG